MTFVRAQFETDGDELLVDSFVQDDATFSCKGPGRTRSTRSRSKLGPPAPQPRGSSLTAFMEEDFCLKTLGSKKPIEIMHRFAVFTRKSAVPQSWDIGELTRLMCMYF